MVVTGLGDRALSSPSRLRGCRIGRETKPICPNLNCLREIYLSDAMSALGSEADMCSAQVHVCFTPNSDRKSGLPAKVMSALPPRADMCGARAHVCYGLIADIGQSFDHRIGAGEYCGRNGEAQCLRGFKIDYKFVLGRRLYRHVGRLLAPENSIDVRGRASVLVDKVNSI